MWYQNLNDRDYLSYEWVDWCLFLENAIHMDTCRSGTLVVLESRLGIEKGTRQTKVRPSRPFQFTPRVPNPVAPSPARPKKHGKINPRRMALFAFGNAQSIFFFYMSISNLIKQPKMGHINPPPFFFLFNSKCQNMWRKEDLILFIYLLFFFYIKETKTKL